MHLQPGDRRPIRIAFCITELDVGGAEQCLVELACGLDRARFEPAVMVLAATPDSTQDLLSRKLNDAEIPVFLLGGRSNWSAAVVLWRLIRQLKAFRPDVLQTFLWHANLLGRLAARAAGVPRTVSGVRVADRRSPWRLRLDRWTDCLVDRHVAVSTSVARFSTSVGGLPDSKMVIIPNGVDLARFQAAVPVRLGELTLPEGARAVLYAGRLDPQKRVDWLLRLLPEVFAARPECHLIIAGQGPDRLRLESLAAELGIANRVHFAGFRYDVPGLIRASEVLLLPSAWEGMPNVILESMAGSRPVMATDVEGVRELLGQAADAQTAPVDQPQVFAARLTQLLSDDKLRSELGAANRARAGEFSVASMIRRYADLYELVCREC